MEASKKVKGEVGGHMAHPALSGASNDSPIFAPNPNIHHSNRTFSTDRGCRLRAVSSRVRVPLLSRSTRPIVVTWVILFFFTLAYAPTISAYAQTGVLSPFQDEKDGISAGGKWMEFRSEDKMTGAKRFRFELGSGNDPREQSDYEPRVELFCTGGKFEQAYFDPGAGLGPPNRPGFWGQPQMEVVVRIDDTHHGHGWNWVRGRVLSMDKGTVRGLIGAKVFKVQVGTGRDQEIAEFSPAGLKLDRVKQACGLTPKKPGK